MTIVATLVLAASAQLEVSGTVTVNGRPANVLCVDHGETVLRFERDGTSAVLPLHCGATVIFSGLLTEGFYDLFVERTRVSGSNRWPEPPEKIASRVAVRTNQLELDLKLPRVDGTLLLHGAAREAYNARRAVIPPDLLFTEKTTGVTRRVVLSDHESKGLAFSAELSPGNWEVRLRLIFAPYDEVLLPAVQIKADKHLALALTARKVHFTVKVNGRPPNTLMARLEGQVKLINRAGTEFQVRLDNDPDPFSFDLIVPPGTYRATADLRAAAARPPPSDPAEAEFPHEPDLYWPWLEQLPAKGFSVTKDGEQIINVVLASLKGDLPLSSCEKLRGLRVTVAPLGKSEQSFDAPSWCRSGHLAWDAVVPPGSYRVVADFERDAQRQNLVLVEKASTQPLK